MAFCTSLVSWYSSTRISRYRAATCLPQLRGCCRPAPTSRPQGQSAPDRRSQQRSAAASPAGTAPQSPPSAPAAPPWPGPRHVRSSIASSSDDRQQARPASSPPPCTAPTPVSARQYPARPSAPWGWKAGGRRRPLPSAGPPPRSGPGPGRQRPADTWRNFSPYPRYSASSPSVRAEADRSRAAQWPAFRRRSTASSSAA